ncbi:MAG: cell division protein FtsZ [Rikenellaceae bacterium]|jgi:cell division protein FtsZ|nr:cell division protein FtsZ [Rikenellaceae bacterium]
MGEELINFNLERVSPSIIMVAGVGGGGSNAVNHMFELGIADVTFMVCNTDRQALSRSPVPIKVKLGENLTGGLGAGNNPERGRDAAMESLDEIVEVFKREGTRMVFVTAGMGGGTGTGAAPVIARAAKELGILTVGIVTLPFRSEGKHRTEQARAGMEEIRQNVDSLLVINNESIQEIYGQLPLTEAFGKADDILASAAKGIAEIITGNGIINVDFADVRTVMTGSGVALMGAGRASGDGRAMRAAELALNSPLLNHNYIDGATNILLNITSGEEEILLDEANQIIEYIQERAGNGANIIWGHGRNMALGQDVEATLIATGFATPPPETGKRPNLGVTPGAHGVSGAPGVPGGLGGVHPAGRPATPFTPGAARKPEAVVPPRPMPTIGQPVQRQGSRIITLGEDKRFDKLEQIVATPAYIRRKVHLTTEEARSGPAVVRRDDNHGDEASRLPSLFD